jgi:protein ImuA
LQERIRRIERGGTRHRGVLPFGVAAIDQALPEGGLVLGALHEIFGSGPDEEDGAAAAGFIAAIAGRAGAFIGAFAADSLQKQQKITGGLVLWCLKHRDLYGPGLAEHGLNPARIALVRAPRDDDLLWALEEGLRTPGVTAVVGEIGRLPMVAGRRLQLAAERAGIPALVLRRWRTGVEAETERTRPSAAMTRWRIAALPSLPDADEPELHGLIGRPRWRVELLRCRGGEPATWNVPVNFRADFAVDFGGADASGLVRLPAELADRPAAPQRPAAAAQEWRKAG